MRAIQFAEPRVIRQIEIEEPGSPGPGDVLLKVDRVGICGTDVGGYLGKMPYFSYPRIPGHELGVEVLEVGDGVENVKVGDRCSVEPYINCQTCYSCTRGYTNCCEHHITLGVMGEGGLTDRIILPARKMHVANHLSAEQCALVETLGIGCHAIDRSRLTEGEVALIIGAGPIGLSALEFAKLTGARVIVMDMVESRLAFVRQTMGVTDTLLTKGDGEERKALEAMTDGRMADVVVDATGSHKSMAGALEYCAYKGRLVYVGITQALIEIPHTPALHRREIDLLASRNALAKDFTRIIELIGNGSIDTNPWITHRVPFDHLVDQFETYTRPETGVIKAVVEVS